MLKLRGVGVVGVLVGLGVLGAQRAGAQTVSITPITQTSGQAFNLTTLGPDGWIKWGSTNPNSGNYLDTTGQTFTTTGFGNGTVNNFDNSFNGNNNVAFTWTNGSAGNNSQIAGVLFRDASSGSMDSTNSGYTVSVPTVGPTGTVQLFVLNFGDAARLNAQLQDGSGTQLNSKTDTSFDTGFNPLTGQGFETGYYTVNYSGAASGDKLVLTYSVGTDYGAQSALGPGYIGVQAAALQGSVPAPEPAVAGLFGIVIVSGLARRRRAN